MAESEMIERVMRAIGTEDGHSLTEADYRNMARAAIAAMREPTEEMVDVFAWVAADAREAAREENRIKFRPNPNAIAECQWVPPAYRAMIDAALQDNSNALRSREAALQELATDAQDMGVYDAPTP